MQHNKKDFNWDNASVRNCVYSLSSSDFLSDEEDTISDASDVTGAKDISTEK
ncbi:hypothetical protein A2U01_0097984, partial [Trifolium medium]|nr:hypothetical protein [Trifolium medium]